MAGGNFIMNGREFHDDTLRLYYKDFHGGRLRILCLQVGILSFLLLDVVSVQSFIFLFLFSVLIKAIGS